MRGCRDWKIGRGLDLRKKVDFYTKHFRELRIKQSTILFYMLRYHWRKYLINKAKKAAAKKKKADAAKKKKKPVTPIAAPVIVTPVKKKGKGHHEKTHKIETTPD